MLVIPRNGCPANVVMVTAGPPDVSETRTGNPERKRLSGSWILTAAVTVTTTSPKLVAGNENAPPDETRLGGAYSTLARGTVGIGNEVNGITAYTLQYRRQTGPMC